MKEKPKYTYEDVDTCILCDVEKKASKILRKSLDYSQ